MFHFRFIPESPRWLLVKNKKEEARKKLQKVAAFNRKEMPDEELELKDAKEGQRTGDFRDLFSSFNMTKRTLISCFSWLVNIYFLYLPYQYLRDMNTIHSTRVRQNFFSDIYMVSSFLQMIWLRSNGLSVQFSDHQDDQTLKKSLMSLIFFPVVEMISFFAWSGTTMSGIIQCGMGSSHLPIFGKKIFSPFCGGFFCETKLHLADNGEGSVGSQSRACIG